MAEYTQPADVLRRVRFFDGQYLIDQDFIDEQHYHLDRERRVARSLGLAGVVDGLAVNADAGKPYTITVAPGSAVDEVGRHLLLTGTVTLALPTDQFSGVTGVDLRLFYRENQAEPAPNDAGYARWDETPVVAAIVGDAIAVAPADAPTRWDSDGVLLGRISVSAHGDVAVDAASPAPRAGLDPRGPFRGSVGVLGDLAVGAAQASTNAAWTRTLDVYGAASSRLAVRSRDITAVVGAHPGGYGAAAGWVAGTESGHAASIVTSNAARVTVTSDGQVGIGTTMPNNEGNWGRVVDLVQQWNARYLVRASQGQVFGFLAAHPDGVFDSAGGVLVGTESAHAVNLVTNRVARLTVTGAGDVGIGTASPAVNGAWTRTLDVYGAASARLAVRSKDITAVVGAHPGGYGAPTGWVAGTESNHAASIVTNNAARLTVTRDGQVGIGTTAPNNQGNWGGVVDLVQQWNARYLVRADQSGIFGFLAAHPDGVFASAPGVLVGTESAHAVNLVTSKTARLTVTSAGDVGIGTVRPTVNQFWGRALDVYAKGAAARLVVRSENDKDNNILGFVGAHRSGYGAASGLVVGTESNHAVSLVSNGATQLTVAPNGDVFCFGTLWIRPAMGPPIPDPEHKLKLTQRWWFRFGLKDAPANMPGEGDALLATPPDESRGYDVSDVRLKEDLREIDGAAALVSKLRGVTFRWNEEGLRFHTRPLEEQFGAGPAATEEEHAAVRAEVREALLPGMRGRRVVGLVAQDVEAVLPELVATNADGVRAVDYRKLTAVLVQAIKEQQQTIITIQGRMAALERRQEDDRA